MIHFKIITPEREVFSEEIDEALIPTKNGQIGILPNHIPLVSLIVPGEILLKKDGKEIPLATSGGFAQIGNNVVTILADAAEYVHEIDEEKAESARARAEERLKEETLSEEEFAHLSSQLERELARIKVKRKWKDVGKSL